MGEPALLRMTVVPQRVAGNELCISLPFSTFLPFVHSMTSDCWVALGLICRAKADADLCMASG